MAYLLQTVLISTRRVFISIAASGFFMGSPYIFIVFKLIYIANKALLVDKDTDPILLTRRGSLT